MLGLKNVVVFLGDGTDTLATGVPPDSLSELYVNFPEPGIDLVTPDFIRGAHRSLQLGGRFVLVTDDGNIAMKAGRSLSRMQDLFESDCPGGRDYIKGTPEEHGTSFFDRLWTDKGFEKRYYTAFRKI